MNEQASRGLRPGALKASLTIAALAWIVLVAIALVRVPANDRWVAWLVVGAWPVLYAFTVGFCYIAGVVAANRSTYWGPAKDLQFRIGSIVMPFWANAVLILLPGIVLVMGLLGLVGLLGNNPA